MHFFTRLWLVVQISDELPYIIRSEKWLNTGYIFVYTKIEPNFRIGRMTYICQDITFPNSKKPKNVRVGSARFACSARTPNQI